MAWSFLQQTLLAKKERTNVERALARAIFSCLINASSNLYHSISALLSCPFAKSSVDTRSTSCSGHEFARSSKGCR